MPGNSSVLGAGQFCSTTDVSRVLTTGSNMVRALLLLPLCSFLLFSGARRWRRHRSLDSSPHSDLFAYHLAAVELIGVIGVLFALGATYGGHQAMEEVAWNVYNFGFFGELCFYVVTCVECYLAVVHPISYRNSRGARGVMIRDAAIAGVWLLCASLTAAGARLDLDDVHTIVLSFSFACIVVVTVCSLSALCLVIRPSPGEAGGAHRVTADQSKRRAFQAILVISAAVWLWFVALIAGTAVMRVAPLSFSVRCLIMESLGWVNLPTCLVSPLLYLHREGRLRCFGVK